MENKHIDEDKYKIVFTVEDVEDYFIWKTSPEMKDVRGEIMIELEKRGLDVIKNDIRSKKL